MSFKPDFTCTFDAYTGYGQTPPFQNLWLAEPCAIWHSRGRESPSVGFGDPPIVVQLAVAVARGARSYAGWQTRDPRWSGRLADWWIVNVPGGPGMSLQPVHEGPMWIGTADAHHRYSCTIAINQLAVSSLLYNGPQAENGQQLPGGRSATFDIYRPWGAAVPTLVAAPGVLWPDPYGGRNRPPGQQGLYWSDILDCLDTVDIRDGVLRNAGTDSTTYADGDEVRFPTGINTTRYVVVKVTRVADPSGAVRKRVYLVRDNPFWPGP